MGQNPQCKCKSIRKKFWRGSGGGRELSIFWGPKPSWHFAQQMDLPQRKPGKLGLSFFQGLLPHVGFFLTLGGTLVTSLTSFSSEEELWISHTPMVQIWLLTFLHLKSFICIQFPTAEVQTLSKAHKACLDLSSLYFQPHFLGSSAMWVLSPPKKAKSFLPVGLKTLLCLLQQQWKIIMRPLT